MPLAKPKPQEEKKEFISRCMSDDIMNKEFPERDQRAAVCYKQWNKKNEEELRNMNKLNERIDKYLGEAKKPSVEKMAKDIVRNIDVNYVIYEKIKEYFEGDIPLSREQWDELYKKIKTKLKKELK